MRLVYDICWYFGRKRISPEWFGREAARAGLDETNNWYEDTARRVLWAAGYEDECLRLGYGSLGGVTGPDDWRVWATVLTPVAVVLSLFLFL